MQLQEGAFHGFECVVATLRRVPEAATRPHKSQSRLSLQMNVSMGLLCTLQVLIFSNP